MYARNTFDINNLAKNVTVKVALRGIKRFTLRLRFALWLMKLAVYISGMGFEVVNELSPPSYVDVTGTALK